MENKREKRRQYKHRARRHNQSYKSTSNYVRDVVVLSLGDPP